VLRVDGAAGPDDGGGYQQQQSPAMKFPLMEARSERRRPHRRTEDEADQLQQRDAVSGQEEMRQERRKNAAVGEQGAAEGTGRGEST
jgi:hypothetical protein